MYAAQFQNVQQQQIPVLNEVLQRTSQPIVISSTLPVTAQQEILTDSVEVIKKISNETEIKNNNNLDKSVKNKSADSIEISNSTNKELSKDSEQ